MRLPRALLLVACLPCGAGGQIFNAREQRLRDQWVFGLSGLVGLPVGDFKQYEDGGGGMDLTIGFQPWRRQPVVLRATGGFLLYGRYSRDTDVEYCDFFGNCQTQTAFYDSRYHNMTFVHVGPEFMATDGAWRPFGFALAGVTWFNSWANYGPPSSNGSAPSRSLLATHNFSTSYGVGVRRVGKTFGRETGFELTMRIVRNAKAVYLNDDGVSRRPDGSYAITQRTGAANVLTIQVGLWAGPYVNWNER